MSGLNNFFKNLDNSTKVAATVEKLKAANIAFLCFRIDLPILFGKHVNIIPRLSCETCLLSKNKGFTVEFVITRANCGFVPRKDKDHGVFRRFYGMYLSVRYYWQLLLNVGTARSFFYGVL